MNILSYRGPGAGGGVAGALSTIIEKHADKHCRWWHSSSDKLLSHFCRNTSLEQVCTIPRAIMNGHYRYCNEFLWPIMHDLPEYAVYNTLSQQHYRQFNLSVSLNLLRSPHLQHHTTCFVHDYQLALAPGILHANPDIDTSIFWHIPWPKQIPETYVPMVLEIAKGLLAASTLGFHTSEYADNFLSFVTKHMYGYRITSNGQRVMRNLETLTAQPHHRRARNNDSTQITIRPLGVDTDFWTSAQKESYSFPEFLNWEKLRSMPFVLSVDRVDYTKGILERLAAIDQFFLTNPSFLGKVSFLQICQPTRVGLPAFDQYWQKCKQQAEAINIRWAHESWQPIVWLDKPVSQGVLSLLYRKAAALLITSLRDGLNLTAKEFVACLDDHPGTLLLSSRAGVWQELGAFAVTLNPFCREDMVKSIKLGLLLPLHERRRLAALMKEQLQANTMSGWWQHFAENHPSYPPNLRFLDRNPSQETATL